MKQTGGRKPQVNGPVETIRSIPAGESLLVRHLGLTELQHAMSYLNERGWKIRMSQRSNGIRVTVHRRMTAVNVPTLAGFTGMIRTLDAGAAMTIAMHPENLATARTLAYQQGKLGYKFSVKRVSGGLTITCKEKPNE